MLRALIISPDSILAESLIRALEHAAGVAVLQVAGHYPIASELARILRVQSPDLIFLDAQHSERAAEAARFIQITESGCQIIATHTSCQSELLLPLMQAGVREFVLSPFDRRSLEDAIGRSKTLLDRRPRAATGGSVFSFLPAKPGAGATTLAINAGAAVSRTPGASTLLADFDLSSGTVGFLLKLRNSYSIVNAVENAARMDEDLWPSFIGKVDGLDAIHAGFGNPGARIHDGRVRLLIDFLRRHYRVLCFDLSGNLEPYSIEVMQESKHIFLVTTPELPALHLARQKLDFLASRDLAGRIVVLLNRANKRSEVPGNKIEEILGVPIHMTFPNDYAGVHRGAAHGRPVDPSSSLGRKAASLGAWMVGAESTASPPARRRFIEYFFIPESADNWTARRDRAE